MKFSLLFKLQPGTQCLNQYYISVQCRPPNLESSWPIYSTFVISQKERQHDFFTFVAHPPFQEKILSWLKIFQIQFKQLFRKSQNIAIYKYFPNPNNRSHYDVIKWKHFPRYWPFVRGIHWSPVNSPQKGQWRGALMFSLICVWINVWVNNREAGDLRRYRAHYDVIVMN